MNILNRRKTQPISSNQEILWMLDEVLKKLDHVIAVVTDEHKCPECDKRSVESWLKNDGI